MMELYFFRVSATAPQADADVLNRFLNTHAVIGIERQFVADGQDSYWSICVQIAPSPVTEKPRKRGTVDYREILSPEVFARYAGVGLRLLLAGGLMSGCTNVA